MKMRFSLWALLLALSTPPVVPNDPFAPYTPNYHKFPADGVELKSVVNTYVTEWKNNVYDETMFWFYWTWAFPTLKKYGPIEEWKTDLVTDMSELFSGKTGVNPDISAWDTSSVTIMTLMFSGATEFNRDISGWDVSKVTNMNRMFQGSNFNRALTGWKTTNLERMMGMFENNVQFNGEFGAEFTTAKVKDMSYAFSGATSFNQELNSWSTVSVTNMEFMFDRASNFNKALSAWDTSNVLQMDGMFKQATSFNQELPFDTSKVFDMTQMFFGATVFNQDISGWVLTKVQNMDSMFIGANAFNQDLCKWKDTFPYDQNPFVGSGCDNTGQPIKLNDGPFCEVLVCVPPTPPPTSSPSNNPTPQPSALPTPLPTHQPSSPPSNNPTPQPSALPTPLPTHQPSSPPSNNPTPQPSALPTPLPTNQPSSPPSNNPTPQPSALPTPLPTHQPSSPPSNNPTPQPSALPTPLPTNQPSSPPSNNPTPQPSALPTPLPTNQPTSAPSKSPTALPKSKPTPTNQPTSAPIANFQSTIPSWQIEYLSASANFNKSSSDEITLNYKIGTGSTFRVNLFPKGCEGSITGANITHTNSVLTDMKDDPSHQNLQLFLNVDKETLAVDESNIYDDSTVSFCIEVELYASSGMAVTEDRHEISINLDFKNDFIIGNITLAQAEISDSQSSTRLSDYVEACTCLNREDNTCNTNKLGKNDYLNVCIKSISDDIEIDFLQSLIMSQTNTEDLVLVKEKSLVSKTTSSLTQARPLWNGVHVASIIPTRFFSYEGDSTATVSGVVFLKFADSRRRLAVEFAEIGGNDSNGPARALQVVDQESSFNIQVLLERDEDANANINSATNTWISDFIAVIIAIGSATAIMMW